MPKQSSARANHNDEPVTHERCDHADNSPSIIHAFHASALHINANLLGRNNTNTGVNNIQYTAQFGNGVLARTASL